MNHNLLHPDLFRASLIHTMPELAKVEAVVTGLKAQVAGKRGQAEVHPEPTGQRWYNNGVALEFISAS